MAAADEFLFLNSAGWTALAAFAAVVALGLNVWAAVFSKRAAEASAETARRSVQLQAAGLPVEFNVTTLGIFAPPEPFATGILVTIANIAAPSVYVHAVSLAGLAFKSAPDRPIFDGEYSLIEASPPRLLHKGEVLSGMLPVDVVKWSAGDEVTGIASIIYSHAKDDEPREFGRSMKSMTWGFPEIGPAGGLESLMGPTAPTPKRRRRRHTS